MTANEFMDKVLDPEFIQKTWPAQRSDQPAPSSSQETAQVVALVGKPKRGRPRKSKTTLRVWYGPLAMEFETDNPIGAGVALIASVEASR